MLVLAFFINILFFMTVAVLVPVPTAFGAVVLPGVRGVGVVVTPLLDDPSFPVAVGVGVMALAVGVASVVILPAFFGFFSLDRLLSPVPPLVLPP